MVAGIDALFPQEWPKPGEVPSPTLHLVDESYHMFLVMQIVPIGEGFEDITKNVGEPGVSGLALLAKLIIELEYGFLGELAYEAGCVEQPIQGDIPSIKGGYRKK